MRGLLILLMLMLCTEGKPEEPVGECVVLLHGLARTASSMKKLAKRLESEGYVAINQGYPSRAETIEALAIATLRRGIDQCPEGQTLNIVTHSLGGILVRHYLRDHSIPTLGRVVMLGPPNQGSQVVDRLKGVPGFGLLNGLAGRQLGTDQTSVPRQLGEADFEVGIVAGSRTINPILSLMLPNPDDGKVSVENTKLAGMTDHIVLPVSHPFLMKNQKAMDQVIHFLRHGRFNHPDESE